MNIIIDEDTHNALQAHILDSIEFGSKMKGTATDNSDSDILHLIVPSTRWALAPYNTNHLLQYKDGDTDHIYCTPHNFVKSIYDGDNTIFHEILHYGALKDTCLYFLHEMYHGEPEHDIEPEYDFMHYKMCRAYVGMALRDLKEVTKLWNKDRNKAKKKFKFSWVAYQMLTGEQYMRVLGDSTDIAQVLSECNYLSGLFSEYRQDLISDLETNKIDRVPPREIIARLDECLDWIEPGSYRTGLSYFRTSHQEGN